MGNAGHFGIHECPSDSSIQVDAAVKKRKVGETGPSEINPLALTLKSYGRDVRNRKLFANHFGIINPQRLAIS